MPFGFDTFSRRAWWQLTCLRFFVQAETSQGRIDADAHPNAMPQQPSQSQSQSQSLLVKTMRSRRNAKPETVAEAMWREEQDILRNVEKQRLELKSAREIAGKNATHHRDDGIDDGSNTDEEEAINYCWRPPKWTIPDNQGTTKRNNGDDVML